MGELDGSHRSGTLYLHVGRGRTGTSSVQHCLSTNRMALPRAGFNYPLEPGLDPQTKARGVGNGSWLAIKLSSQGQTDDAWPQFQAWLADAVRAGSPNIIVSSEFFWNLSTAQLERIRGIAASLGLGTVVIAYVREQASHMISVYCQRVRKGKETVSLPDYLTRRAGALGRHQIGINGLYDAVLDKFETVFGDANLRVGLFARPHLVDADVRTDFFAKLGLPATGFDLSHRIANESAGIVEIDLLRRLNAHRHLFAIDGRRLFNFARARGMNSSRDFESQVPQATLDRIRDYYAVANERMRERYFSDVPAPLFPPRPAGQPLSDGDVEMQSMRLLKAAFDHSKHKTVGADFDTVNAAVFSTASTGEYAAHTDLL